jgi:hypothetical protein
METNLEKDKIHNQSPSEIKCKWFWNLISIKNQTSWVNNKFGRGNLVQWRKLWIN